MKKRWKVLFLLSLAASLIVVGSAFAQSGQSAQPKHFKLAGTVKSVNTKEHQLTVQHGNIPGFMNAMTMPYGVKKEEDLTKISPGDQIQADIMVSDKESHLENVKVTGHAKEKEK